MANLHEADIKINWSWSLEKFHVTGHVDFLFGGTKYRLKLDQHVVMEPTLISIQDQLDHILIQIATNLGKGTGADLAEHAVVVQTFV